MNKSNECYLGRYSFFQAKTKEDSTLGVSSEASKGWNDWWRKPNPRFRPHRKPQYKHQYCGCGGSSLYTHCYRCFEGKAFQWVTEGRIEKKKSSRRSPSRKQLFINTVTQKKDNNEMSDILPIVLTKLQKAKLFLDFCNFLRLIRIDEFSLQNIAMSLFFEVVRWYSLENTPLLIYSDDCMKFRKVFYRPFHDIIVNMPL